MSRCVLAIDLGETTGYCYFRGYPNGEFLPWSWGTVPLDGLTGLPGGLMKQDVVVVERMAWGEGTRAQLPGMQAISQIQQLYRINTLHIIRATDWKQRFGKKPLPGRGLLKTQHEKDAYRIGLYAIEELLHP